jgi:hypothetical protein
MPSIPRTSMLRTAPQQLSIMSYNLLAPIYVRPIDERTGAIMPFAAFPWAEPADKVLNWDARQPRLLKELLDSEADVLCLQEVQFECMPLSDESVSAGKCSYVLPEWLREPLEGAGYTACVPSQKELRNMGERNERVLRVHAPVGNALLYRSDRLEQVDTPPPSKADAGVGGGASGEGAKAKGLEGTTRIGVCVSGRVGSDLEGLIDRLALFCVHLDATSEEKRVKLLARCLEHARGAFHTRNVLIAGDMNTELLRGSCVGAMVARGISFAPGEDPEVGAEAEAEAEAEPTEAELARECASALRVGADEPGDESGGEGSGGETERDREKSKAQGSGLKPAAAQGVAGEGATVAATGAAPSAEQLEAWRELYHSARHSVRSQRIVLHRIPTGGTRAAYAHGTNAPPCVNWRLDHLLYTPRSLRLLQWSATLEECPESAARGLPNADFPSDHLSIGAAFELRRPPALSEREAELLLERVRTLSEEQAEERAQLSERLAVDERALDEAERAAAKAAASSTAEGMATEEAVEAAKAGGKRKVKKRGGGGPPSQEMIQLKRKRREQERELKEEQAAMRRGVWERLSELEKDVLEAHAMDALMQT